MSQSPIMTVEQIEACRDTPIIAINGKLKRDLCDLALSALRAQAPAQPDANRMQRRIAIEDLAARLTDAEKTVSDIVKSDSPDKEVTGVRMGWGAWALLRAAIIAIIEQECEPASAPAREQGEAVAWEYTTTYGNKLLSFTRTPMLDIYKFERPLYAAPAPQAVELQPCGHHVSLLVKSVESDHQFCELCEERSMRRDAETREQELSELLRQSRGYVVGHAMDEEGELTARIDAALPEEKS